MARRFPETDPGLPMHFAAGNKGHLPEQVVKPVQVSLFEWRKLAAAHLVAIDHPRPVYYDIRIEGCARGYRVCKESGILGRKPDRRVWRFETLAAAEKEYRRRIRAKTNLRRKSVRKYVLADGGGDFGGNVKKVGKFEALRGRISGDLEWGHTLLYRM